MATLFEPLNIRDVTLSNRIAVSPMCQYSSVDGYATDWHLVHLGSRAVGGASLVFTEATAVSPEGRISPDDLGIWEDGHIKMLKRITDFLHTQGAVAGIQLAHAGRKASHSSPWKGNKAIPADAGGWATVAPSAAAYRDTDPLPAALDAEGIAKVRLDFTAAAHRAIKAGFDVIEIHAAHGYLINNFLSPLSNFRKDEYGGSFENRIRLLLELVADLRKIMPQGMPLFVRISATDWVDGGWTAVDSVALAKLLGDAGVDLIDCSSGGNSPMQSIPVQPLYQVGFAEKIKITAGVLTGAVGLITTAQQAQQVIEEGQADLVLLARQVLREPYFVLHAAHDLEIDLKWPVQYERAKKY